MINKTKTKALTNKEIIKLVDMRLLISFLFCILSSLAMRLRNPFPKPKLDNEIHPSIERIVCQTPKDSLPKKFKKIGTEKKEIIMVTDL